MLPPIDPPPVQPLVSSRRLLSRKGLLLGVLAGVLVVALVTLSVIHYRGPTATAQRFLRDFLVTFDAHDAYSLLCPDAQRQPTNSLSVYEQEIAFEKQLFTSNVTLDGSHLTYTLKDENFFGQAHVQVGGYLVTRELGKTDQTPASIPFTLTSSGLGWCLEYILRTTTTPST